MLADRKVFEDFHSDPQFADLRNLRSQLQPLMRVLLSNVRGYQCASSSLEPSAIPRLREYMLKMFQLEHAMINACKNMPPELEKVKSRILEDFDTTEPAAYLEKINGWLRSIEGRN